MPHHPLCIQLLDLVAQKYHYSGDKEQAAHWLQLAYQESLMVYGEKAQWTIYQEGRMKDGLPEREETGEQQQ